MSINHIEAENHYGTVHAHAFHSNFGGFVHLAVRSTEDSSAGDLTPGEARQFAARVIAAADEAERHGKAHA